MIQPGPPDQPRTEAVRNVLVEAVNARDIALLDDHLDPDRAEQVRESLRDVNNRWPRLMLTRADRAKTPVAAVWLPDPDEDYRRVGAFELEVDQQGRLIGLEFVEGIDPGILAEAPLSDEVAEWESMSELSAGEGNWI